MTNKHLFYSIYLKIVLFFLYYYREMYVTCFIYAMFILFYKVNLKNNILFLQKRCFKYNIVVLHEHFIIKRRKLEFLALNGKSFKPDSFKTCLSVKFSNKNNSNRIWQWCRQFQLKVMNLVENTKREDCARSHFRQQT